MDNTTPSNLLRDVTIIAGLIGVAGTLLGVVLGFSLQRIGKRSEEIEAAKTAKAALLATPVQSWIYPNLYPHLRALRHFFIKHPAYLKHGPNNLFFGKWLTDPMIDTAMDTAHWKDERKEEMLKDLSEVKVWLLNRRLF